MVKILIGAGADKEKVDFENATGLERATEEKKFDFVK